MMDSRSPINSPQSNELNQNLIIAIFKGKLDDAKRYLEAGADINSTYCLSADWAIRILSYSDVYPKPGDTALSIAVRHDSSEKVAFLLDNHVAPSSVLKLLLEERCLGYSFGYAVASLLCTAVTKQDVSVAQLQPVVEFVKRAEVRLRKEPSNTNSLYADFVFSLHCHYAKSAESDLMYYLAQNFFWGGESFSQAASLTKTDLKIVKNRLFELISGVQDTNLQRKLCTDALDDTQSNLLSAILYIQAGLYACDKTSGTLGKITKLLAPKRVFSSSGFFEAAGPRRTPQVKPPALSPQVQPENPSANNNGYDDNLYSLNK